MQGPALKKMSQMTGVNAGNILRHPDAHPIALDMLLLRQYGPEWLTWEGETLQQLAPNDFHGQVLSDLNLAKIQACRTLHLVDTYWERWEVFGWCTAAFNGEYPDFDTMQVPSVAQVLVSVDIANRIRDDLAWADEVQAYIGAVFQHDGVFVALPPADFISIAPIDPPLDINAVMARWPEVRATARVPAGNLPVDEELRRLLTVHEYLEASRERLRYQLGILTNV